MHYLTEAIYLGSAAALALKLPTWTSARARMIESAALVTVTALGGAAAAPLSPGLAVLAYLFARAHRVLAAGRGTQELDPRAKRWGFDPAVAALDLHLLPLGGYVVEQLLLGRPGPVFTLSSSFTAIMFAVTALSSRRGAAAVALASIVPAMIALGAR